MPNYEFTTEDVEYLRLGEKRVRRRFAELPPRRRRLSQYSDRHQLRDPLAEVPRARPQGPPRPNRHRRPVERRAPRDAGGDAAERFPIRFAPVAGGLTRGRCDG